MYSNGALDESEEDFLNYMPKMLGYFAKTKALFVSQDFSEGLTRFV
jgi:hypothetical protein